MEIFRSERPTVNEQTVMYRNPLGKKDGRNKMIYGAVTAVIAAALCGVGVFYILHDGLSLGILLQVAAAAYIALSVVYFVNGARLSVRPYAVIVDSDNLIIREKSDYLHLPLKKMRRLTIDCEGIEAYLSVAADGEYDVLIKGDTLYYTVDGLQSSICSRYMRKIAFVLNGIAIGGESGVNWGEKFDDAILSEHTSDHGAEFGLNKALDESLPQSGEKTEEASESGAGDDAEEEK